MERTLQDWLGELTHNGYDIVGTSGHTNRGDWNTNHPMPKLIVHLNNGKHDIVLTCYATNSYHWTIYGTAFRGKAPNVRFGHKVSGRKEIEIPDYDALPNVM